jgi:hypothetical protein
MREWTDTTVLQSHYVFACVFTSEPLCVCMCFYFRATSCLRVFFVFEGKAYGAIIVLKNKL